MTLSGTVQRRVQCAKTLCISQSVAVFNRSWKQNLIVSLPVSKTLPLKLHYQSSINESIKIL